MNLKMWAYLLIPGGGGMKYAINLCFANEWIYFSVWTSAQRKVQALSAVSS